MDKLYVSFVLKPLLESAVGGRVFEGKAALRKIRGKMAEAKEKLPRAVVVNDYRPCTKAINHYLREMQRSPGQIRKIEREACKDSRIRKVIGVLAEHGFSKGVEYLFAAEKNYPRQYDGDAAKKLIKEIASFLRVEIPYIGNEVANGVSWLSEQSIARHAFGPKNKKGKPLKRGSELRVVKLSEDERYARCFVDHLIERHFLYCEEHMLDPERVLNSEQLIIAERLWRQREVYRGTRLRSVDAKLSKWRKAYFKLIGPPG